MNSRSLRNVSEKDEEMKFNVIPHRFIISFMTFLAIVNAYQMRISLNVAMSEMVLVDPQSNGNETDIDPNEYCERLPDEPPPKTIPPGTVQFDWTDNTQTLILSSFYIGYLFTHLPAGYLADRYGGKYALGVGIFITSILTFLVPLAAKGGITTLIITRIIIGLAEGATFPAISSLLAKWVPAENRGLLGSCVLSGGQIGAVTGLWLSDYLLEEYPGNWELIFYVFGSSGLIWCIVWFPLCYSSPSKHPFITDIEKEYLMGKIPQSETFKGPPWKKILTSAPVYALICAQIGHDWVFYTMVTDLPTYMDQVLKYRFHHNAILSSIPFLLMYITSVTSGWLCDEAIKLQIVNVTAARRLFATVADIGPSIGLVGASFAGCNRIIVVFMFCVAMATMGFHYPGIKVNTIDLSPNYAGTIMAISNGLGAITGIITPFIVDILTPQHSYLEWRMVFWITAVVNVGTLLVFLAYSSGDTQPWDDPKNND